MSRLRPTRRLVSTIILCGLLLLVTGATLRYADSAKHFLVAYEIFTEVLQRIREDYVEETSADVLLKHAIDGMLNELDPHSSYLGADYFSRFNQDYEGYSGIGIEFDIINDRITVMTVMRGGPAEEAGLQPGDRITAINGTNAVGFTRDEAPKHLMGPKGSTVEVLVQRHGQSTPLPFKIIRNEVHVESVPYAFMIQPGLGYVAIVRFSATTGDELEKALVALKAEGMTSLILDLRGNGGGYLDAAVDVVDCLLPAGRRIVYTQGRGRGSFQEFYTTGRRYQGDFPVMVMLNRISASASEIVAGALQDWDRGLVVGETSFGKALVQSQYRFRDGSALLMTTARYYTPSGRLIQRSYEGRSLEDYYAEVLDDSLRQAWLARTDRPQRKTLTLKRLVTGGGGITPDITLKAKPDTVGLLIRRLARSPKRLFFTFSENHLKSHPKLKGEFTSFLRTFQPSRALLADFIRYAREQGVTISVMPTDQELEDIRFFLKQSMADILWGDVARYKVQLLRDVVLLEALEHVPQAQTLLAQAQRP